MYSDITNRFIKRMLEISQIFDAMLLDSGHIMNDYYVLVDDVIKEYSELEFRASFDAIPKGNFRELEMKYAIMGYWMMLVRDDIIANSSPNPSLGELIEMKSQLYRQFKTNISIETKTEFIGINNFVFSIVGDNIFTQIELLRNKERVFIVNDY